MSFNKIYTVPDYDLPRYEAKPKRKKSVPVQDSFAWSRENSAARKRIQEINVSVAKLKQEKQELVAALKKRENLKNQNRLREVKLYALQLEDGCWYVGMSYDPARRFVKHCKGKGARWTQTHPPVKLYETRLTGKFIQDEVARMEDDMTLEYALKYGSRYVRGGGYCQAKPLWPEMIRDNERVEL